MKFMKGSFNFFKFSTFQILGNNSQVQLEISPTLPQILGPSEPPHQCGDAAELCICRENYIQHFCLPWKALWIRWSGSERIGMKRYLALRHLHMYASSKEKLMGKYFSRIIFKC